MANKKKNYPQDTLNDLQIIADRLNKLMVTAGFSIRGIAQKSGISINSIKSVLDGQTANIATYDAVARVFGTSLLNLLQGPSDASNEAEALGDQEEVESPTDATIEASEVADTSPSFLGKDTVV